MFIAITTSAVVMALARILPALIVIPLPPAAAALSANHAHFSGIVDVVIVGGGGIGIAFRVPP